MPAIRREFLEWSQPALPNAARWLLKRAPAAGDLSGCIVVIPGGRAGRRLVEILVRTCAEDDVGLSPPKIVTMGALPEMLYAPQRPFADDLTQRLAWVDALKTVANQRETRDELNRHIPAFPSTKDITRLLELADMLRGEHLELAADGLDFSDVARHTAELGNASETDRWTLLQKTQRAYLDVLDGLQLWDKQTARLEAIKRKECRTEKQIVLLGTVDMNRAARQMLDLVADSVTALIIAPRKLANRFDQHGCVIPAEWADARIPMDDTRLVLADDPLDQADEAVRALAAWQESKGLFSVGRYGPEQITIGVCDERIVPQIARQFDQCGLTARWGPGRTVAETAPYQLLRVVADYLERPRMREFAALVRHPDVEAWLNQQQEIQSLASTDWLTALDGYQSLHVPARLSEQWLGEEDERTKDGVAAAKAIHAAVVGQLGEWTANSLPLAQWPKLVTRFLLEIYRDRQFDPQIDADRLSLAGLEELHTALTNQQSISESLAPEITASDAIRWALEAVASDTISAPADPTAIEILGWLELPLDDAPALVVTSLNEGHVPQSMTGDMFLPDTLRTRLGLDDNARRYARDAYALSVLVASRAAQFIVGRRDADGNPLAPSRLLFACDDDTLVARAKAFFTPPPPRAAKQPLAGPSVAVRKKSTFTVPRPEPLPKPIDQLRVTAFRDYIACPYRFYLKQVKRLQAVDDAAEELDGGAFGSLAHDILNAFGRDERRHTTSAEEIDALLEEYRQQFIMQMYGAEPRAAVAVQCEQLHRRLQTFATVQAEWASAGWRIVYTEVPTDDITCELEVDGQPFRLSGRIDRIDFHEPSGAWAIWDYKTGDTARRPGATHQRQEEWIDLQLPLYRHLAAKVDSKLESILDVEGKLQLGYVQIPKNTDGICFEPAFWSGAELAAADECAHAVIRKIRNEEFWPPADPPPDFSADLAGICLDGVFGRVL